MTKLDKFFLWLCQDIQPVSVIIDNIKNVDYKDYWHELRQHYSFIKSVYIITFYEVVKKRGYHV